MRDADFSGAEVNTFAKEIRGKFEKQLSKIPARQQIAEERDDGVQQVDILKTYEEKAIKALKNSGQLMKKIRNTGAPWGEVQAFLLDYFPDDFYDRKQQAYYLVPKALNQILGLQGDAWESYRPEERNTAYVRVIK